MVQKGENCRTQKHHPKDMEMKHSFFYSYNASENKDKDKDAEHTGCNI